MTDAKRFRFWQWLLALRWPAAIAVAISLALAFADSLEDDAFIRHSTSVENAILAMQADDRGIVGSFYEKLAGQVDFFSSIPPVLGAPRALANKGFDPVDGNSLQQWQSRFRSIAKSLLQSDPDLYGVTFFSVSPRLVALAHVSVTDSTPGTLGGPPAGELALKLPWAKLVEQADNVHFSNVTRLDEGPWSGRAVLYAARALRAPDGQLFGAMQVAYSIDRVLSAITDPGIDKVSEWVVDQDGRYLVRAGSASEDSSKALLLRTFSSEFSEEPGSKVSDRSGELKGRFMRDSSGELWLMYSRGMARGALPSLDQSQSFRLYSGIKVDDLKAEASAAVRLQQLMVWTLMGTALALVLRVGLSSSSGGWRGSPGVEATALAKPSSVGRMQGLAISALVGVLISALTYLLVSVLLPGITHTYLAMTVGILLASLVSGFAAGLAATLVGAIGAIDLATPSSPLFSLAGADANHVISAVFMILLGVALSYSLHRTRELSRIALQAERARREVADQHARILATGSDGIHVLDSQGKLIEWTGAFAEMLGYSPAEMKDLHVSDWDVSIPKEQMQSNLDFLFRQKQRIIFSTRHRRKSGEIYDVELALRAVEVNGQPMLYVSARDITERVAAETAVRLSETKFRNLWEYSLDAHSLRFPPDWELADCNPAMVTLMGAHSVEHLKSFPLESLYPLHQPDGEVSMEVLQRAFGTALEQGSFRGELRLKPPGKGPMDCDLSMTRVVLDGRVGVQTTLRDITASKAAQDEQRRLLAERTTLLDEVHHRVKNNLQVVSSLLYLQQSSSNDADVVEQLQVSRDRIAAISLVHERLYRTSDFGRIDVQPFLVELCESIRAATIAGDRVKLNVYGTDFALELGEAVPIALIVSELISNSMKHAFPGGRRGAIRLWTGFVSGGKRMIRVSDDGVGMRGDPKRVGSLGLDLVQRLAGQISATVAREDSVKGVCWVLQLAAVDIRVDEDVQVVQ